MSKSVRKPRANDLAVAAVESLIEGILRRPYALLGDDFFDLTGPLFDSFFPEGSPSDEIDEFLAARQGRALNEADGQALRRLVVEHNYRYRDMGYLLGVAIGQRLGGAR
jgi:hypothetical protein